MPAPRRNDPQPKFSAFAIMILILLGIFALMSRADQIFKNCKPFIDEIRQKQTAAVQEPQTNDTSSNVRRVTTVIENSSAQSVIPEPTNSVEVRNVIRNDEVAIPQREAEDRASSISGVEGFYEAEEDVALPQFPVVPPKPERGDKLSTRFAMASDMIPAEALMREPKVKPDSAPVYQPAAPVPAAPTRARPVARQNTRRYTMRREDTLWKVSTRFYGNGKYWKDIVAANPGLKPETIHPGTTIVLPRLSCEKSLMTGTFED